MRLSSTNSTILALNKEKVNTFSENIFNEVKRRVTVPDAFRLYVGGERIRRGGMVHCVFHNDATPSMRLNADYYYCYGCGCHGDVVDLVARLYDLNPWNAVRKLNYDFSLGLPVDGGRPPTAAERLEMERQRQEAEELARFRRWRSDTLDELAVAWRTCNECSEIDPDKLTPAMVEAVRVKPLIEFYEAALDGGDEAQGLNLYHNNRAAIVRLLLAAKEAERDAG